VCVCVRVRARVCVRAAGCTYCDLNVGILTSAAIMTPFIMQTNHNDPACRERLQNKDVVGQACARFLFSPV